MPGAVCQAHPFEQLRCAAARDVRGASSQKRGQLDVLDSGQLVHQMEGLEDEADRPAAQPGQGLLAEPVDAPLLKPHLPGRRPFEAAQQVQQRRLAAAARTHHRQRLARGDGQIDPVDCAHEAVSLAVVLLQTARPQNRPHARQRLVRVHDCPFV
jgi:hypothetical protein